MDCINNLIAISLTDCECVTRGLTQGQILEIRKGVSGLSLDDLKEGINLKPIQNLGNCESFIELSTGSRSTATKNLRDDLIAGIGKKYNQRKAKYIGQIGRLSFTGGLRISKQYQVVRLRANQISDAIITVKSIRLITSKSVETPYRIVKAYDGNFIGEVLQEGTVMTAANNFVNLPINPIALPLSENGNKLDYYFIWESIDGNEPRDNSLSCNCGGVSYESYLQATGGEIDNIEMLDLKNYGGYSRGLSIDVEIECKTGNLICREYDSQNAVAVVMAWALLYKTGAILVGSILSSPEVNRYTMLDREHLYGIRNHYEKEYNLRVNYLIETINVTSSDCFVCRDHNIGMATILV